MSPYTAYEHPLRDLALTVPYDATAPVGNDGLTDAERSELAARKASRRPSVEGRREFEAWRARSSAA